MRFVHRRLAPVIAGGLLASIAATALVAVSVSSAGWTAPKRVTPIGNARLDALHELAATDTALHLVHARIGPGIGGDHLVYQRSTNGGSTWSKERDLYVSGTTYRTLIPNLAIAASGRQVVVAYRARGPKVAGLFVRISHDGGTTFVSRIQLAGAADGRGLGVPAVVISEGAILVAWTDRATGNVRLRRSTNGGRSFSGPKTIAHSDLSIVCADADIVDGLVGLAAAGSTVHLAWSDAQPGKCIAGRIRIRTSHDLGKTFGAPRLVSDTDTFGWPELAVRGRRLLLSLQRPSGSLLIVRSINGGRTFTEQELKPPKGRSLGAGDVALLAKGVAWIVFPDLDYHGSDIKTTRLRFRQSNDGGRTWRAGDTIVPEADKLREAPNLASWKGSPVVVFQSGPTDLSRTDLWSMRRT